MSAPTPGRVRWLIAAFAGVSFVSAAVAAHLPATLQHMHVAADLAVWIAASIGVTQALGRALEFVLGPHVSAAKLGLFTLAAILAALLALLGSATAPALAVVFALVYLERQMAC